MVLCRSRVWVNVRCLALSLIVLLSGCAGHKPPAYVPIMRYVFVEDLPPETELCVRKNPWVSDLACLTLGDFRANVRGIRRASLP